VRSTLLAYLFDEILSFSSSPFDFNSPLLFRFFEDLVRLPDHNYFVISESSETCEPCGPRFPYSSVIPFVVRAFLVPSKAPSCPVASRVPLPILLIVPCLLSPSGSSKIRFGDRATTSSSRNSSGPANSRPLSRALPLSHQPQKLSRFHPGIRFPECPSPVAGASRFSRFCFLRLEDCRRCAHLGQQTLRDANQSHDLSSNSQSNSLLSLCLWVSIPNDSHTC